MRQLSDEQLASKLWRIPTDGPPEPVGDDLPQLDELQRYVGGYIEHVRCDFRGEAHLFVNEDGESLGLAPNGFATLLRAAHACTSRDEIAETLARGVTPQVFASHVIVGDAWLWFGPLPADA